MGNFPESTFASYMEANFLIPNAYANSGTIRLALSKYTIAKSCAQAMNP